MESHLTTTPLLKSSFSHFPILKKTLNSTSPTNFAWREGGRVNGVALYFTFDVA